MADALIAIGFVLLIVALMLGPGLSLLRKFLDRMFRS